MRHLFLAALLLFCCIPGYAQKAKPVALNYNRHIKIPSSWIYKLRHYRYKHNNLAKYDRHNATLLKEFDSFLKSDSLFIPDYDKDLDKSQGGVLNPMFADLDGEPGDEMLCLLGWDNNYPSMGVFKKIGDEWYLLYLRQFYMFYAEPELNIANSYSKSKTFYYREVYGHGSGVFEDGYSFFKLINNKVYDCLTLTNDTREFGMGPFMEQQISMTFKFNGTSADNIWAYYKYDFSSSLNREDCDKCPLVQASLIKGEGGMNYRWNNKQFKYLPDDSPSVPSNMLNKKKVACFGNFNDTLFVRAFNYEIKQTLKTGTRKQKAILKQYLNQLKKNKTATTI